MVLVSESFPSDHNSVNNIRILYRCSLLNAAAEAQKNMKLQQEPFSLDPVTCSQSTNCKEPIIKEDKIITNKKSYSDFDDFLQHSKQHQDSSDSLDANIKKVQTLVDRITRMSIEDFVAGNETMHTLYDRDASVVLSDSTDNSFYFCSARQSMDTLPSGDSVSQSPEYYELPMVSTISTLIESPNVSNKKPPPKTQPVNSRYLNVFKSLGTPESARRLVKPAMEYGAWNKLKGAKKASPDSTRGATRLNTFFGHRRNPLPLPVVNIQLI